jgi:hypothetical protein
MAIQNKTTHKAAIDADIVTNGTGSITATKDNTLRNNFADSVKFSNTTVSSLGTNPTTWDVSSFEQAKSSATFDTNTTLTLSNSSSDGRYIIDVNKNTASDVVVTIAHAGLTIKNPNNSPGLTLSGANGDNYKIEIERIGSNLYVRTDNYTASVYPQGLNTTTTITCSDNNHRYYEKIYFSVAPGAIISQNISLITLANSEMVHVTADVTGMEDSTGDTGFNSTVISTWKKNSAGTLSQVGTTTIVHTAEDLSSTPTYVFSNSSGTLRLAVGSGSAGVGVSFTAKFKILVSAIT